MVFSVEDTSKWPTRPSTNVSLSHAQIQVPSNNTGLNSSGPLTHTIFSINTAQHYKCIFFSLYFLNTISFPLAYFILRVQCIIHTTYKIICQLTSGLPVDSKLLVVKFDCMGVGAPKPPTPCWGSTVYTVHMSVLWEWAEPSGPFSL